MNCMPFLNEAVIMMNFVEKKKVLVKQLNYFLSLNVMSHKYLVDKDFSGSIL